MKRIQVMLLCFSSFLNLSSSQPPTNHVISVVNDNSPSFTQTMSVHDSTTTTKTIPRTRTPIQKHKALTHLHKAHNHPNSSHTTITNNNHGEFSQEVEIPRSRTILDPDCPIDEIIGQPSGWNTTTGSSSIFGSLYNYLGKGVYIAGALVITYGVLLAKLMRDAYYINNSVGWSSWRQEIPLETLALEKQVPQELFAAIQLQYYNKPSTACFLTPLVHFINAVDNELDLLVGFIKAHDWIKYIKLSALVPSHTQELLRAAEKIKRLKFYKQIIIQLVGEYKI